MVRFLRTTPGTHLENVDKRGPHVIVFEEADLPDRLKAAQGQWSWSTVSAQGSAVELLSVPYGEFARVLGPVMWIAGLGFPTKSFTDHCVGESGLDRSWKAVLLGMADWSPCRPGDFLARVRQAAANPLVDRNLLRIEEADLYEIRPFDSTDAALADLSWVSRLTFTPGALADAADGTLGVMADLEYYSEDRIPVAGKGVDSAFVACLRQNYEGAVAAMVAAGSTATLMAQLRPASKAGLVAHHISKLTLPAPLQSFSPPGLAREAEGFTRVAYLASAGVGPAAERVVIPLLESALDWADWAIIKTALEGSLPGHPKVELLRRWQAVFAMTAPDTITVGSLNRLATLLDEMAAVVRSPEISDLPPAARPEHFARGRSASRPLTAGGGGTDVASTTRQVGALRLDAKRLERLHANQDYLDQKRAMLAFIAADKPLDALRVVLRGVAPLSAAEAAAHAAAGTRPPPPPPPRPLAIFHFLLGSTAESWLVDPELRPMDALRAHLPAYAGDVVMRAMRVQGEVKLELSDFVAKWRAPENWDKPAGVLDAVNDVWLPALAALHGGDGMADASSYRRVPHAAIYADQNQLTSVRVHFGALMRGFGFPDTNSSDASAPLSLDDIFEAVLERHATHGVLASLAPGVSSKGKALFEGAMAEHGVARAAVLSSRDPTSALPAQWVQNPSAAWQRWRRDSIDYEEHARRSRLDRLGLASTPVTPLRADLGHSSCFSSQAFPATPIMPPPPGASAAVEIAALRARLAELGDAGGSPLAPGLNGKGAHKRLAPGDVARCGAFSADGTRFVMGKKEFDLVAWRDALTKLGIDPATRCAAWSLCHGEDAGRGKAECPSWEAHRDTDFHKAIPKLKPSAFDVSRTAEEREATRAKHAEARKARSKAKAGDTAGA